MSNPNSSNNNSGQNPEPEQSNPQTRSERAKSIERPDSTHFVHRIGDSQNFSEPKGETIRFVNLDDD